MNPFKLGALICSVLLAQPAGGEDGESAPTPKVRASMYALDNVTKLERGWSVGVRIIEDKREELQLEIAATGELHVPYLGPRKAAGMTCRELAFQMKADLEKTFFKMATVLVTSKFKPREPERIVDFYDPDYVPSVFVSGNVSKTGRLAFPDHEGLTVSGMLSLVGSPDSKRSAPKIQIIRKTPQGNKTILVNTKAALVQKHSEYDLFLRDGDVVSVE
jgi:polysaccharide export outer membrane protein